MKALSLSLLVASAGLQAADDSERIKELNEMAARITERKAITAQASARPGPPNSSAVNEQIVNGGFDDVGARDESGQFGEAMFAPGSKLLRGWSVSDGLVGLRDNPRSPAGGLVLELGPRDTPGCVSQTIRTEPGKSYTLSFLACSGRAGGNRQVVVRAGELKKTVDCANGNSFEKVSMPFKATKPQTLISISGLGNDGFGPMLDDIRIE